MTALTESFQDFPIVCPSMDSMGTISFMVLQKKALSASNNSSGLKYFSTKGISSFSQMSITVLRVMPGKILSGGGVNMMPSFS